MCVCVNRPSVGVAVIVCGVVDTDGLTRESTVDFCKCVVLCTFFLKPRL